MSSTPEKKSFARFLPPVGRILLGLPLLAFGFMGLFHPMQTPPGTPEGARAFTEALQHSGYMMPLIFGTQIVSAVLLLSNRFVPLALLLLAPFFLNSLAFHVFLEPGGLVPALVFCALELALAWAYRKVFAQVLRARN
jgi:hypothetical protein